MTTTHQPMTELKAREWGLIVYAMQGLGPMLFISLFIGIGVNYWLRPKTLGTVAESHFKWQLKTFWYTFSLTITGIMTAYFHVGYLFIAAGTILLCVRTVWGAIQLYRCQPM